MKMKCSDTWLRKQTLSILDGLPKRATKRDVELCSIKISLLFDEREKELREMKPDTISAGDFPIIELIEEIMGE